MNIEEPIIRRGGDYMTLEVDVDGITKILYRMPLIPDGLINKLPMLSENSKLSKEDVAGLALYNMVDLVTAELLDTRWQLCQDIRHFKRGPKFPKKYNTVLIDYFKFNVKAIKKTVEGMGIKEFVEAFISYDTAEVDKFKTAFDRYVKKAGPDYFVE
jgi:hypothetical protein